MYTSSTRRQPARKPRDPATPTAARRPVITPPALATWRRLVGERAFAANRDAVHEFESEMDGIAVDKIRQDMAEKLKSGR